jgi:transcriptional regulator with XRE-family HTH domain
MHLNKEEIAKLVGQRIREIRLKKRLTIEEAAHNAGLEYTQLSRIELGKINTSIYHVFVISETLEVKVHDVFREVYKNHKQNNHSATPSANGNGSKVTESNRHNGHNGKKRKV